MTIEITMDQQLQFSIREQSEQSEQSKLMPPPPILNRSITGDTEKATDIDSDEEYIPLRCDNSIKRNAEFGTDSNCTREAIHAIEELTNGLKFDYLNAVDGSAVALIRRAIDSLKLIGSCNECIEYLDFRVALRKLCDKIVERVSTLYELIHVIDSEWEEMLTFNPDDCDPDDPGDETRSAEEAAQFLQKRSFQFDGDPMGKAEYFGLLYARARYQINRFYDTIWHLDLAGYPEHDGEEWQAMDREMNSKAQFFEQTAEERLAYAIDSAY
ncbi:hypothetical protein AWENTII_009780 [Aspergillus wentii]